MACAAASVVKVFTEFCESQIENGLLQAEIENILKELSYWIPVLEKYGYMLGSKMRVDPLEEQIEDELDKLKFLMDACFIHEACQILDEQSAFHYSKDLREIQEEITSLTKKMEGKLRKLEEEEVKEEENRKLGKSSLSIDYAVISSRVYHPSSGKEGSNKLVGLDDELARLVRRILIATSDDELKIMSIVGMAGLGKTTLVQQLHDHPSILSHFDARIMVTLGPNFTFREYLLLVLNHMGVDSIKRLENLGDEELKIHLLECLKCQNWLIVLDDLWNVDVLNNLRELLTKNKSKSHIIVTTRLWEIGIPDHEELDKCFLNDESSWDLLREVTFTNPEERCTYKLENFGRQIAKNCEGLPLAIIWVGKLLSQNKKTIEFWESVSKDDNPLNIGIDYTTPISKSLYLSYEMLPQYLKPSFLYVGVFPKSYKMDTGRLVRFLLIEGLVVPQPGIRIEDTALEMLYELGKRCLVLMPGMKDASGKFEKFRVHTVIRSLCIGVAQKEGFCHVIKKYNYSFPRRTNQQPRICIHSNTVLSIKEVRSTLELIPTLRTLLCFGPKDTYHPLHLDFNIPLLKTLDALTICFHTFPEQVLQLFRLKYLALTYDVEVPNSISRLRKLETLIIGRHQNIRSLKFPSYWPVGIWDLSELKYLHCMGSDLQCVNGDPVLFDLLSLKGISSRSFKMLSNYNLPTLLVLEIQIYLAPDEVENLSFFLDVIPKITSLYEFKCDISGSNSQIIIPSASPIFPSRIEKISLSGCRFPWEYMSSAIGRLPNLKTLKLRSHAFHGFVWEPCPGEFPKLITLLLEDLDIMEWRVEHNHFPELMQLIIRHCYRLREISLWNMKALDIIRIEDCSSSLVNLAKKMEASTNNDHTEFYISTTSSDD